MRVTLQDYVTDPSLFQKDGVNLAHENISALMARGGFSGLSVEFHEINRLLSDESYARRTLSGVDWVISNIGPHAHYYFHLREKLDLGFRIVRDVRTAIWSSYLLQEHLCEPHLREADVLLVASRYTRGIYERIFPHLRKARIIRCYPLTVGFPRRLPARSNGRAIFTLGYVGRLSVDKNFSDVVDLVLALNRINERRFRLVACGDVHSPICAPDRIRQQLHRKLGHADAFTYFPPRNNGQVWELYRSFDAMAFPSTSNLETLGRVLVEASYADVPVVCGDHAAAPELVAPESLCGVKYCADKTYSTHFDHSLGTLDVSELARAVLDPELRASQCHCNFESHGELLMHLLREPDARDLEEDGPVILSHSQRAFVDALDVTLPPAMDGTTATEKVGDLIPWFLGLQRRHPVPREAWLESLRRLSHFPERTQGFIERSGGTRCDYTNVGGIDIEICHVADFFPTFRIRQFYVNDTLSGFDTSQRNTQGDAN